MLINNIHENEYGIDGELYLPLWEKIVKVSIPSKEKIPYAEKCADYITNLDNSIVVRLARYSYRYFKEFEVNLDDEDIEMPRDTSEEEILNYIYPSVLIIEEKCRDEIIEFHMECECAWEIEHGLEFTISDNRILYVGAFDDMPPYNQERLDYCGFFDPDDDMNMNYADKELRGTTWNITKKNILIFYWKTPVRAFVISFHRDMLKTPADEPLMMELQAEILQH